MVWHGFARSWPPSDATALPLGRRSSGAGTRTPNLRFTKPLLWHDPHIANVVLCQARHPPQHLTASQVLYQTGKSRAWSASRLRCASIASRPCSSSALITPEINPMPCRSCGGAFFGPCLSPTLSWGRAHEVWCCATIQGRYPRVDRDGDQTSRSTASSGRPFQFRVARTWVILKAPRPQEEHIAFTLASYNAGAGHIIKAQRLVATGQSPNHWSPVAAQLHLVTGKNADETRGYVVRIRRLFKTLSAHPP
jgi:hypothetical protein